MSSLLAKIESLTDLHQFCWDQLQSACNDKFHPMREISLATLADEQTVAQRLVILRQANPNTPSLDTYTDIRSNKVNQLRKCPQLHYLAWHPKLRLQLRIQAKATLHHEDEFARSAWQQLSDFSKSLYSAKISPGKIIPSFQMGVDAYLHSSEVDTEAWRQNFLLIKAQVLSLECLVLGREKQLRASFTYQNEAYDAKWLVP